MASAIEGQSVEISYPGCPDLCVALGEAILPFSPSGILLDGIPVSGYNIRFEEFQEVISKNYPGSQTIKNLKVGDRVITVGFLYRINIMGEDTYLDFSERLDPNSSKELYGALKFISEKIDERGRYHVKCAKLRALMDLSELLSHALKGIKRGNYLRFGSESVCID